MDAAVLVQHNMEPPMSPNPLRSPPPGPLQPLSPERINQQRLLQSPPFNGYHAENDRPRSRDSMASDVQSKVAFLNSLAGIANGSVPSSPTRPARKTNDSNNALQRAVMGYEEAQASLATLNAELEREREESASRKKRERMLAQRVEQLLEELQTEKVKRSRDQEAYAKEIKRCRKEAYRAELAVVEARQDLQEARSDLKKSQAELQHEKTEKDKSRQESFERAYALAGMVGEMEQLKDKLKVVEKERDAALSEVKTSNMETYANYDEYENIGSNRDIEQQDEQTFFTQKAHGDSQHASAEYPPAATGFEALRFRLNYYDKQMEGAEITPLEEIQFLKQELRYARMRHAEDADMIHFMSMQCQFKACPCRQAEEKGERFIHDHAYEAFMQDQRAAKKRRISTEMTHAQPTQQIASEAGHQNSEAKSETAPAMMDEEACILPPEPISESLSRPAEESLLLDEAIEVPLPEARPMELDPREFTPEPTAQLEEKIGRAHV